MTPRRHEKEEDPRRWGLLATFGACFFPGALLGTQLAGLLFFLNPHLPFETVPVLRGAVFYGALLGYAGLPILLMGCRGQQSWSYRLLPAWLTAALSAGAAVFWVHAYYFGFFLPPGINRRLLKAAISLTVAALVCFYTIVLHRLRRRPYGARSQILFAAMALLSIYVVMERREAFRPSPEPSPRPTTITSTTRPQLAVVAVDAATLEAVLPLAEQGRLPFLASCLELGAHGRVEALVPVRETALWTTVATGLVPYRHGVVGEQRYESPFLGRESTAEDDLRIVPVGMAFERWGTLGIGRLVGRKEMLALPMWEVLTHLGRSTAAIGWPATEPPSTSDAGFILTDAFFKNTAVGRTADTSSPASQQLEQRARLFATRPADLDPTVVARFGPRPDPTVLRYLSQDIWRRDLTFYLLEQEEVDVLFVHLPGLGVVSQQHYGGFEAVHFRGSTKPKSEDSARWVSAYYTDLDAFLARLWDSMEDQRQLVLVSSHGVRGPEGLNDLVRVVSRKPARHGSWNDGPDGLLVLRGSGFRAGAALGQVHLVDLAPTLLYGQGLPVARDLDGVVLTQAFDPSFLARQPLSFVPSYETFVSPER
ncbi:MAG: alkaline phosphatase family protein [Thermoanaerobaculia bacterium]|nr:alkaline phosphatase family protein [Thermoanaerobaculia bacterium]